MGAFSATILSSPFPPTMTFGILQQVGDSGYVVDYGHTDLDFKRS
jgi:hypothetical protein